jgi:putative ABC transport system permease protein
MARLAWSQLRFRTARVMALLVGLLLATSAFTVLTAASRTSQLRTVGTVTAHFVPAYEILVRPKGARTKLETETDSVEPNFLSGIYGGITMAQYRKIAQIPGVQVAAPIAMVGYALLNAPITYSLPSADFARPGRQLYRSSTTWVSESGTSRIEQPPSYLYVTPDPLQYVNSNNAGAVGSMNEVLPRRKSVSVCPFRTLTPQENPFGVAGQSDAACWSKVNGWGPPPFDMGASSPKMVVDWVLPVLIAAIDPVAEAKLDGLDKALISGAYLSENAGDRSAPGNTTAFPVLASSAIGMDEYAQTQLQTLATPESPPTMSLNWMTREIDAPG